MGIPVTLRILKKQTRKKMKLLILSVLVAYALCECPEVKDPECKGSDLRCGQGETDSEGCPMQEWCMHVDPYAHCSAKAMCPVHCGEDAYMCKGDTDHEGCQMPDSCFAKNTDVVQTFAINLATGLLKSSVPLHLTAKVVKEVQLVLQKILGAQHAVQFIVMRTK